MPFLVVSPMVFLKKVHLNTPSQVRFECTVWHNTMFSLFVMLFLHMADHIPLVEIRKVTKFTFDLLSSVHFAGMGLDGAIIFVVKITKLTLVFVIP